MSDQERMNLPATTGRTEAGDGAELQPVQLSALIPESGQFWSSIDGRDPRKRVLLYQALDGDSDGFESIIGESVRLTDVVAAHRSVLNDKTGELTQYTRVCLILADGRCVAGGSGGVRRSLANLFGCFGLPPWPDGIPVSLKQIALPDGKRMYKLIVDPNKIAADIDAREASAKAPGKRAK